jgi:hypothetical protein
MRVPKQALQQRAGLVLVVSAVLLTLVALASCAGDARAGGVSFNWGTVCYTAAPSNLHAFACDTDYGAQPMTLSFRLDSEMTDMVGLEIEVEGVSDATELPDWWKLGATDCRANGLSYTGDNSGVADAGCRDWNGGTGFAVPVNYTWDSNRAHVTCGYAIDASAPRDLPANVEHYAGTLSLHHAGTIGDGACSGCATGFTWWISRITVAGLSGRRDELTTAMPGGNQFLYWNRAARTSSALALVSAPNPAGYQAPVTLTASVTPATATGEVEFREHDTALGTAPVTGGVATLSVSSLAEGDHALIARYGGDGVVERAFAPAWTQTVTPRPASSVALTSSPNPSALGHPVQMTAQISPADAAGSVTFRDGETTLATLPLSGGSATYTRNSGLTIGLHDLTAVYGGDATHAPATSPVYSHLVGDRLPTSVTFTATPTTVATLQWVQCEVRVTPPEATGTVQIIDQHGETWPYGSGPMDDGRLSFKLAFSCGGTYVMHAYYMGSAGYAPSSSETVTLVAVPNAAQATVGVTPTYVCPGQPVTLTSRVTNLNNQGTCSPGTVQFLLDGAPLGGPVPLLVEYATLGGVTTIPPGSHSVQAVYSGDASLGACKSPLASLFVRPAAPTTAADTTGPNPSRPGEAVTLTATVTAPSGCAPPGAVQFEVDGVPFGAPVALASGVAALGGVTTLAPGAHAVRVLYAGQGFYPACASPVTTHVVAEDPLIVSVQDVPDDQGGQVAVVWSPGCAPASVVEYWILRSLPPAAAAAPDGGSVLQLELDGVTTSWEYVACLPATQDATGSYVATTTADAGPGSTPEAVFLIEARLADGGRVYSAPAGGYSVDNLAPGTPRPFHLTAGHAGNHLAWTAPPDADVAAYRLYRGPSVDDFVPGPENLLATTTGTAFDDPTAGPATYRLSAVDVHGNEGASSMTSTEGIAAVGDERLAFGLERVGPNPSRGDRLRVAFTLAEPGAAHLLLLDVTGRRVAEQDVGALGTGRHVVELGSGLAPGLYVVRLDQGARVRALRVAVLD